MANPINAEVEQKLLICALETNNPKIRALILSKTEAEDYGYEHGEAVRRRIDRLLQMGKFSLTGKSVSSTDFAADPALSKGAADFICGTKKMREQAARFSLSRVQTHIRTLKRYRQLREVYHVQQRVNELATGEVSEDDIDQICAEYEDGLTRIRGDSGKQEITHFGRKQSKEDARQMLKKTLSYNPAQFVSTGLEGLDEMIRGWERGNLVTISAPSGGGKSATAMSMAINQYLRSNHNVCFVSMEMTETELYRRLLANISRVNHDTIRYARELTAEQKKRIGKAAGNFWKHGQEDGCDFSIWDSKGMGFTPQRMETFLAPFQYDVVVIDYITLFDSKGMDTWKMQMEYSKYLKGMAKRLNCVPVVLTQLSEDEQIKYGRAVKENTDYWLWWRWREDEEQLTGQVEIRLDKARHTSKQRIRAQFMLDIMRIETSGAYSPPSSMAKNGNSTMAELSARMADRAGTF